MIITGESDSISFLKDKITSSQFELLDKYKKIVQTQTQNFNLISKNTIDQIWHRHILDSYQLINYIDINDKLIDIGSGAGFPGIILKILGVKKLDMVDSINKKIEFINTTLNILGYPNCAHHIRIEDCSIYNNFNLSVTDILTARALKPLKEILHLISKSIKVRKKILLLKGQKVFEEIKDAEKFWDLKYKLYPSLTSHNSFTLEISEYKNLRHS